MSQSPERQRFAINLGPWPLRLLLGLFGAWSRTAYIDVTPDVVEVRMGFPFRHRIPRDAIRAVRRRGVPALLGWGWRFDFRGGVYLLGSHRGIVQIEVSEPFRTWKIMRTRRVTMSLIDPDGLIRALSPPQEQ